MVTVIKEYKRNQNTLVYLFLGKESTFRIQNEFPPPLPHDLYGNTIFI